MPGLFVFIHVYLVTEPNSSLCYQGSKSNFLNFNEILTLKNTRTKSSARVHEHVFLVMTAAVQLYS